MWRKSLAPHREYMKKYQAPAGPLKLEHLVGSYVVRCVEAEEYRRKDDPVMSLGIVPARSAHGTTAAFDFSLMRETMLLALSDDALHLLRQEVEVDFDEEEDDDRNADDSDDNSYSGSGPQKRKKNASHATQFPIKRRLGETPNPNRVYLQWAGREAGEDVIAVDSDNEHIGYLDFDASKASARGSIPLSVGFWEGGNPVRDPQDCR